MLPPSAPEIDLWRGLAIFGTGLASGFFNITAGGGSFLSVPLLIFFGFPAAVANGTNRVALVVQALATIPSFRRGGIKGMRQAGPLLVAVIPGALLGAWLAVTISDRSFRNLFAAFMVAMSAWVLVKPAGGTREPEVGHRYRGLTIVAFALIGIYGGLIQAGVGFLIVFALSGLERFTLVRSHAYKILVVLVMQLVAFPVFVGNESVDWRAALLLAIAYSVGGSVGARLVLQGADRTLRIVFAGCALLLAVVLVLR